MNNFGQHYKYSFGGFSGLGVAGASGGGPPGIGVPATMTSSVSNGEKSRKSSERTSSGCGTSTNCEENVNSSALPLNSPLQLQPPQMSLSFSGPSNNSNRGTQQQQHQQNLVRNSLIGIGDLDKLKLDASVQTDLIVNLRKLVKKRNSNIFASNLITKISIWVSLFFFLIELTDTS